TIVSDTYNIARANPFRYRGYYWDNDLQLYYLMSRYYDSQTGRFINADGLEYLDPETIGGLNLYAYCGNNPVMHTDPMGTISIILLAGLIGFGISFVSSIISQAAEDGEVKLSVALVDGVFGGVDGALSAMGLNLNPFVGAFVDICLDYANNVLTTLIENEGNLTLDDLKKIGKSAVITGTFSLISSAFKFGFDDDFVWRANKDIKNINKKLSKGLYKTTKQAARAQKTIHSYINQAFNSKVFAQYGMDILSTIIKGIDL
ncbi:MAG: RHS repeat-associated core domain-containing protein, partial [Clostridia bacterium]|nr:RHS repeat-associated core domain-containing protein [Clostridia bacterium]